MNSNNQNLCHFGCLNTETGEFKEVYIKKHLGRSEMKYRNPLPWWKRMFGMKDIHSLWGKPEYVSKTVLYVYVNGRRIEYESPIYKETHLNGDNRYYLYDHKANYGQGANRPIEPTAFEKKGDVLFI